MGLFHAVSQWVETRNKKRIVNFELQGTCPACQGKGFNMLESEMLLTNSYYDCPGCNGSGSFSDWIETNQIL